MSDFPNRGDIEKTRAWLDSKGFHGFFDGWEADAILGLDKSDIIDLVPGEHSRRLWGFLNTARECQRGIIITIVKALFKITFEYY